MPSKERIVIIHFQPLEFYPPVQNLLLLLKQSGIQKDILVISTTQTKLNVFCLNDDFIKISRKNILSSKRIFRLFKYFYFYLFSFFKVISLRPSKVLYFESISAFPAIVYKLIINKAQLFVHYHEYTTPEEYQSGMQIVKWNHSLEVKNYSKFDWISHTNHKRLELFKRDNKNIKDEVCYVMPNYPLSNWIVQKNRTKSKSKSQNQPIRLVYVGALSCEDTYISEIIKFVIDQPDKYDLEIFSFQFSEELNKLIGNRKSENVRYSGPINYKDIPKVLLEKDVGLILYKGNTTNYIYNAPNKLFEYLACNLDVWYPSEMEGCYEFSSNENPKVIKVDYKNIRESVSNYFFSGENRYVSRCYCAEIATKKLIQVILN